MSRREQLQEMLSAEPNDVFLNYALAKAMVESGETDEGIAQFQKTLQIDPKHVPSYFQMAQAQAADGDVDPARKTLTQGIQIAREAGDEHAEMEMTEFLDTLQ